MVRTGIGAEHRAFESEAAQNLDGFGGAPRQGRPGLGRGSGSGQVADGIEAGIELERRRVEPPGAGDLDEKAGGFEPGKSGRLQAKRQAVEFDAAQRMIKGRAVAREPEAPCRCGTREGENETVGAVLEFIERGRVGEVRFGDIEP